MFERVHAFEINPELTAGIKALGRTNVEVVESGLSDRHGAATLFTPVLNGIPMTGWASLQPGNCPDTDEHREQAVVVATLDSYQVTNVSFMKIDVEGHELEVLNGGRATIEATRPAILIEIKDRNLAEVHQFFDSLDYVSKRLEDFVGIPGSRENYIFVHHVDVSKVVRT